MTDYDGIIGLTFTNIEVSDDTIIFTTDLGRKFEMSHDQDCCEIVYIESIVGSIDDLLNTPILTYEVAREDDDVNPQDDLSIWTFYKFGTIKGYVDIRWYGSSNGYYSVSVNFDEIT